MATKRAKKPVQLPEAGLLRKKAKISRENWRKLGRPCWVIRVYEQWTTHKGGWVYYPNRIPMNEDLDVLIRLPRYSTALQVGYFAANEGRFVDIVPSPVVMVPDAEADRAKLHIGHSEPFLLWDRSVSERTAQRSAAES